MIAGNSDGVWNNEGKTLDITVLAPFYETRWFEILALLTLGLWSRCHGDIACRSFSEHRLPSRPFPGS